MTRPQLPSTDVRKILAAKGITVPSGSVAILGVRGYYRDSMGATGKNDRGIYDDAAFVALHDRVIPFNFNTDPSAFRAGIATLIPGIWTFTPGWHKLGKASGHVALRQLGDFTVSRDGKGEYRGQFGINLHRGGNNGTSSLGCQTVPPDQWIEFRNTVYRAIGVNTNLVSIWTSTIKGKVVTYVLVTREEVEKILGRKLWE